MRNLLADPRGRWLFDANHREARSEWALTAVIDGRPQMFATDRSFIDAEGTRWIVDFKTSRHEGGDLQRFLAEERARYKGDRKSTRLNSRHYCAPRMPSYACKQK